MCHLTGYIGNENCVPIILEALKIQEGIIGGQATGIAIKNDKGIFMEKDIGPVDDFRKKFSLDSANIGFGHTRYALKNVTTAETNKREKAHPFWNSDKSFITMHNGTLFNYEVFVKDLEEKGYQFRSKSVYLNNESNEVIDYCDSEIFSFLLEEELKKSDDIKECIRKACSNLKGHFAFVVIHPNYPDEIFLANWMQPMFIGRSNEAVFFSSFKEGFTGMEDKFAEINQPQKNVLLTLKHGSISFETLLLDKEIPDFHFINDIWYPAIKKAISENYNDLARIWWYTFENPELVNLTKDEYNEIIMNGYTFTPKIYSMLKELILLEEIQTKLEIIWEGGINHTPRYKYYLV
jgi:glucosamine 6-phosphate synthetase-like amidotransferase/phosphosugar isomerase protein